MSELIRQEPEEEEVVCPKCNGTGYNKWGDTCYYCGGEGIIYEED
jgi:DnaJ-class molecular chaperone